MRTWKIWVSASSGSSAGMIFSVTTCAMTAFHISSEHSCNRLAALLNPVCLASQFDSYLQRQSAHLPSVTAF